LLSVQQHGDMWDRIVATIVEVPVLLPYAAQQGSQHIEI
jgi:hypothetical protein